MATPKNWGVKRVSPPNMAYILSENGDLLHCCALRGPPAGLVIVTVCYVMTTAPVLLVPTAAPTGCRAQHSQHQTATLLLSLDIQGMVTMWMFTFQKRHGATAN